MKKSLIILSLVFIGCSNKVTNKNTVSPDFTHQLYNIKGGWQYSVVEFENHKYLCTARGGITHVESCQCKKD